MILTPALTLPAPLGADASIVRKEKRMINKILCLIGWHSWHYKVIQFNGRCKPIGEIYPWANCIHCNSHYGTKQKTFIFCSCNNELTSTGSFVKDEDLVYYKCSECGEESRWDFDLPVPFRINF